MPKTTRRRAKRSAASPPTAAEPSSLEGRDIDFIPAILADREKAVGARDSFVEYLKFAGRSQDGERLRLDDEVIRSAEAFARAYAGGKDFGAEQFRGSLKSTQAVYAHAWMLSREPRLTVGHFSCRDDEAFRRNEWLQSALRQSEHVAVFGEEATPAEGVCNRTETSIKANPRAKASPNIVARGIESARAGPHYHRLWGDDLVDEKSSLAEPARLALVKERWYRTVRPMLISRTLCLQMGLQGGGATYYDGTPYADNDLHAEMVGAARRDAKVTHEAPPYSWVYESERHVFRRLACGGQDEGFHAPCPTLITPGELGEIYERNPRAYDMAYRLVAVGLGEKPFSRIFYWLPQKWQVRPALVSHCGYQPPQLPDVEKDAATRKWFRILSVDPGFTEGRGASYTGYVVMALGEGGVIYVLYANQFRKRWDEGRQVLASVGKSWAVDKVIVEQAAQQDALLSYFRDQGFGYVEGASTSSQSKLRRAMDVSADVNGGRVVLPGYVLAARQTILPAGLRSGHGNIQELVNQMLAFPAVDRCDLMDAFVYGVQDLRKRAAPRAATLATQPLTGDAERIRLFLEHMGQEARSEPVGAMPEWEVFEEEMSWLN